ncbi:MAG: recombination mediator RecR [Clostridia bacterium]|jgi:recombination protein RecR|nr:recombination mediator RecR [Clostridia bacterium]MDD4275441.1 recombination mediator RecR [Clostridia bacterium]
MKNYVEPIAKLINHFSKLPGVGQKTAQRYAYSVIRMNEEEIKGFANSILEVKQKIKYCSVCGNFTDVDPCGICTSRISDTICVVQEPKDVLAMEKVRDYSGLYHVLHGTISPMENRGPNDIRIKELLSRVSSGKIKEVIIATNPDVEGEATALYIARILKPLGIKVTRIAQGISMGSDLEYADEVTLNRAFEDRKEL